MTATAPDWYLDRILVQSYKYGASKQAVFNRWIDTTAPFSQFSQWGAGQGHASWSVGALGPYGGG
jgi:hypothetical protein